jgi:hypothetical protein
LDGATDLLPLRAGLERVPIRLNRKRALGSLHDRIFCGKPVSPSGQAQGQAFPENAPAQKRNPAEAGSKFWEQRAQRVRRSPSTERLTAEPAARFPAIPNILYRFPRTTLGGRSHGFERRSQGFERRVTTQSEGVELAVGRGVFTVHLSLPWGPARATFRIQEQARETTS